MRMMQLFNRTLRQAPLEAELPSHRLILRAGLAYQVASGIYSLTPLGYRAVRHIEAKIRQSMEQLGGQEVLLPIVQPAELWQATDRYNSPELMKLSNRNGHPLVLALTHEEAASQLATSYIASHRHLPMLLFQIQTKVRDEARPRGGLIRLREFTMKDAYSFHASQSDLDSFYERMKAAYLDIFHQMDLPVLAVESATGLMGGRQAHEFILLNPGGEDTLLLCPACNYAANQEAATSAHPTSEAPTNMESIHLIHTPNASSIADLCQVAGCMPEQTLKCVFFTSGHNVILALIRGDLDVNPSKLEGLLGSEVRTLSAVEAAAAGLVTGFTGPVGIQVTMPLIIVADETVLANGNMITGANRPDYHLGGVNYGRDFQADLIGDIALVCAGAGCPQCGQPLIAQRGIEVGNIFKLGTKYSQALALSFTAEDGSTQPVIMGSYGIGIERLLACIIEQNHDDDGIIWPADIAPYSYHLLTAGRDQSVQDIADEVYHRMGEANTLYDDRNISIGVKLKDADLLGMPIRITISSRSLAAGGAEVRFRKTKATQIVALDQLASCSNHMVGR